MSNGSLVDLEAGCLQDGAPKFCCSCCCLCDGLAHSDRYLVRERPGSKDDHSRDLAEARVVATPHGVAGAEVLDLDPLNGGQAGQEDVTTAGLGDDDEDDDNNHEAINDDEECEEHDDEDCGLSDQGHQSRK